MVFGRDRVVATVQSADKIIYNWPRIGAAVALSVGVAVAGPLGWLGRGAMDFTQNYFSAEQAAKRYELTLRKEADAKAAEERKVEDAAIAKAAEETKLAMERKAGEERLTPELKGQIFVRADLKKAACYPEGYGFEAKVDANGRIVYFKEQSVFTRNQFRERWSNAEMLKECADNLILDPYWQTKNLGDAVTPAHFDVMKDIYVMCATGVREAESAVVKDGVLTYSFGIASEKAPLHDHDQYVEYWTCVNNSATAPVFQPK